MTPHLGIPTSNALTSGRHDLYIGANHLDCHGVLALTVSHEIATHKDLKQTVVDRR